MKLNGKITNYQGIAGNIKGVDGKDYILLDKNLVDKNENSVGIFFEKMDKNDLFRYVSQSGALPRKTFSMGENVEKRYYLEGRKIK